MNHEVERAAASWAEQLAAWAIPDAILRRAPESPWGFPTELFIRNTESAMAAAAASPSQRRALEALGGGGSVLDVGSGAGAASLPLAPAATHISAVDESQSMLDAFDRLARSQSIPHRAVKGRWPDVAPAIDSADVVVCHHVLYNVPDIVPFIRALDDHAGRRVVIELTEVHPQSDLNDLWQRLHGIERPDGPVARDVADLLEKLGLRAHMECFEQPNLWTDADRQTRVAFARRRLCVGSDRDPEIEPFLKSSDRRLVTLWWDTNR